jgi:hypothetical protein
MYLAYRAVSAPSNGALSHGAIAGIVVAVVAFTAAIAFGLWTYQRRRAKRPAFKPGIDDLCLGDCEAHEYPDISGMGLGIIPDCEFGTTIVPLASSGRNSVETQSLTLPRRHQAADQESFDKPTAGRARIRQWFSTADNFLRNAAHQKLDVSDYQDQEAPRFPEVPGEMLRNPAFERIEEQYSQMREISRAESAYVPTIASASRLGAGSNLPYLSLHPESIGLEPSIRSQPGPPSLPSRRDNLEIKSPIHHHQRRQEPFAPQEPAQEVREDDFPTTSSSITRRQPPERDIQGFQMPSRQIPSHRMPARHQGGGHDSAIILHGPYSRREYESSSTNPSQLPPASETYDTIDPWQLEYRPNPVIFAHLADCFGSPSNDEHVPEVLQTNASRSPEVVSEQRVYQNSKRRMSDSSDVGDLEAFLGHGEAPTMTSSQPKRRAYSRGLIQEPNRSISGLFMSHSGSPPVTPGPPNLIHTVPSSPAQGEPKSDQLSSDESQRTTPASTLSVYGSTPESSAPSEGDQSLACTECDMSFRTSGQRREHQNRKHTRRFKCDMCDRAFNLQADLGRHERTVHKSDGGAIDGGHEESPLKCPNKGCKTADKVWDRKDNLWRHIVRCRKALGMVA